MNGRRAALLKRNISNVTHSEETHTATITVPSRALSDECARTRMGTFDYCALAGQLPPLGQGKGTVLIEDIAAIQMIVLIE